MSNGSMEGQNNKSVEKGLLAFILALLLPPLGCIGVVLITVSVILAGAGSILGWLFGGGAPLGEGNETAPAGAIHFYTPTPIPPSCFITPTAQAITVPPLTPGGTPGLEYLPTPTPCPTPRDNWATPDPRWTPAPPGYGPHGSPFRSKYVFTQPYGCTDFPEFKNEDCAAATKGVRPWFHRGVDMVALGDKTVYATIAGAVEFAGFAGDGFGNRVYVHSGEFLVIYPHLSRVLVGAGQSVVWGQPIGVEGSTGYSTGSHLHYEIHINGAWVDSTPYLYR